MKLLSNVSFCPLSEMCVDESAEESNELTCVEKQFCEKLVTFHEFDDEKKLQNGGQMNCLRKDNRQLREFLLLFSDIKYNKKQQQKQQQELPLNENYEEMWSELWRQRRASNSWDDKKMMMTGVHLMGSCLVPNYVRLDRLRLPSSLVEYVVLRTSEQIINWIVHTFVLCLLVGFFILACLFVTVSLFNFYNQGKRKQINYVNLC